jgi:hypothetical protein
MADIMPKIKSCDLSLSKTCCEEKGKKNNDGKLGGLK